jgi:uncharacterized protein
MGHGLCAQVEDRAYLGRRMGRTMTMKVAVTGTHGLVARHLLPHLRADGHEVVALVRGPAGPGEVSWDPATAALDPADLAGIDAAIHLAGVGIFGRWTPAHKQAVLDSRVRGTTLLAERIASLDRRPAVLLSASAVGWYGDRGPEILDETSRPGSGFLAQVCRSWEAATAPAADAGIRTVNLRSGIVLAGDGGSLKAQLPLFRLGLGGRLGDGEQWTSWISAADEVGAILHALASHDLRGPVNLTAPGPVTNRAFTRALAGAVHRPAGLAVPGFALKAVLGPQMATEMLLAGQRVLPRALEASGYVFAHPDIEAGLASALAP